MDDKKYELIVCIVNDGYNEVVMNTARSLGAKGGTVINGRGTVNETTASAFNISITPEKEIVLLVVPIEIKDELLHALYKEVGINQPGQGVIFTVPVDETAGIGKKSIEGIKAEEVNYDEYLKSKGIEIENGEIKETDKNKEEK